MAKENGSVGREPYEVIGQLVATARMHRKEAEHYVRSTGLHPTQHRMLMYLSRREGSLKQKELAEHFELTPAAVAQTLDKLEEEGFVARIASPEDARCKHVALTEKGAETARSSREAFLSFDKRLLRGISDEDLAVFCDVLRRMQENHASAEGGPDV